VTRKEQIAFHVANLVEDLLMMGISEDEHFRSHWDDYFVKIEDQEGLERIVSPTQEEALSVLDDEHFASEVMKVVREQVKAAYEDIHDYDLQRSK